jgi:hypothetical protein
MELIPILATIILMATISTFFLAIGAYVLYKIRERKGASVEKLQPQTIKAELVTPEALAEQAPSMIEQQQRAPMARPFERPNPPSYRPSMEPIFVQKRASQPAPERVATEAPVQVRQEAPKAGPGPAPSQSSERKFMKYTAEGYVSAKDDKKQGAVKWR